MYEDNPSPSHPSRIKNKLFLIIKIIIDNTNINNNSRNCFCSILGM